MPIGDENIARGRRQRQPSQRRRFGRSSAFSPSSRAASTRSSASSVVTSSRVELLERAALDAGEPERLPVQRLLEDRAGVAGVAEALAAGRAGEDPLERLVRARAELVLVLGRQPARDLEQVVRRVVGEGDLAREAGAQAGVRVEEGAHQPRVAGDDDDEPVAVVLHPLQERLDRLGAEVEAPVPAAGRERVRLVDEEHAVERAPDRPIGLDRRLADVLADERGAVDLDEVSLLEQAHGAVHLGEQPGDGRLAGAGVAEEDEVLARRDLGQVVLLPPRLHLQEGEQRVHLLLDRLEPDEPVELRLQLGQRPRRRRLLAEAEQVLELRAGRPPQLVADAAGGVAEVLDRIRSARGGCTRDQRSSSARCSSATCCSSRATRSSRGVCVEPTLSTFVERIGSGSRAASSSPPPSSWRQRSWLWPGRRGSFSASSSAASASSALLDVLERAERVEPLDALLQLAGRLRRRAASARRAGRSATGRGRAPRRAGAGTWRRGCPGRWRAAPSLGARACRARPGSPPRRSRRRDRGSSPGCRRAGARSAKAGTGRASSAASRSGSRARGSRRRLRPRGER